MIGLAPLDLGRKRSFEMPRVFLYTSFCSTSSWEEDNGERKTEGREHEVKWMEGEGWMERGGGKWRQRMYTQSKKKRNFKQ